MYTEHDKAIVTFITSALGIWAASNPMVASWLNPTVVTAVTPFIAAIATWAVPNKKPAQPTQ